jgi:hypothetical protein
MPLAEPVQNFYRIRIVKSHFLFYPAGIILLAEIGWSGFFKGNAQVDFLVQKGSSIIPIEAKSGTQGSMQSLRLFMKEKHIVRGIRTLENFGRYEDIDIYPLYAIGNIVRG